MLQLNSPDNFTSELFKRANELGINQLSSSSIDLRNASQHFHIWIEKQFHGEMNYMEKHGDKRYHPEKLVEGTLSVLTCQLNYYNPDLHAESLLKETDKGIIAQYALGRDYHRVLRKKLTELGKWLQTQIPNLEFRAFVDSAPVLERALNHQSGLGFFGKNTMIIHPKRGSFFFLGELFINRDINIAIESSMKTHCGQCQRCIDICPTNAIVAPFQLDARRCISYLTIEHFGVFPEEFRRLIGNRIFGCDDCQLICPWNRFAEKQILQDFHPRYNLENSFLRTLFNWTENEFLTKTEGSPIRRLGYIRWLRNIAIGIGNDNFHPENVRLLEIKLSSTDDPSVKEHISWALNEQNIKQ